MNKVIGLINAWSCDTFIEPAMLQAVEYCDEVIVSVGYHSEEVKQFEDNTLSIVNEFVDHDKVKYVPTYFGGTHYESKTPTLNAMLQASDNFEVGNWIWLLDCDEFYFREDWEDIKKNIFDSEYDCVETKEKFFYVNMQHYLLNDRRRLFKITDKSDHYVPLQRWNRPKENVFKHDSYMYHYSLLLNPYCKKAFWSTEYPTEQNYKVHWMDEVYLKFDLNDQETWVEKNNQMFGHKTPFQISDFITNDGLLFNHEGEHPHCIEDTILPEIKYFRTIYKEERTV